MSRRRWIAVLLAAAVWQTLVLLLGCATLSLLTRTDLDRVQERIGAALPETVQAEVEDTHGGFHGDGDTKVVGVFPSRAAAQAFARSLPDTWSPLPVEDAALWAAVKGYWPDLPQGVEGYWFRLDRFLEQHGEASSFNPYLQNSTFALLDLDSGVLYVLETDF